MRSADVFLTNMPLDVRARLGIRWADLEPLNGRLIYASLTAYGESGPEANKTGFDATAWWARTGLMDNVRSGPDAPPARSIPGMGDHATAMALFGAVMMALYQRERTGKGGMVSTSLMAAGLWSNAMYVQAHLCGAAVRQRPPREQALNALGNMYRCGDDRWFILAALSEERQWPGFVRALDRPDLAEDPRFATLAARRKHVRDLVAELDEIFATRPWAEWRERLDAEGITFGGIAKLEDLAGDRQMLETGALTPLVGSGRRGRAHREQPGVLRGRGEGRAGAARPASASTRTRSCGPAGTARPRSRRCGARASWRVHPSHELGEPPPAQCSAEQLTGPAHDRPSSPRIRGGGELKALLSHDEQRLRHCHYRRGLDRRGACTGRRSLDSSETAHLKPPGSDVSL